MKTPVSVHRDGNAALLKIRAAVQFNFLHVAPHSPFAAPFHLYPFPNLGFFLWKSTRR